LRLGDGALTGQPADPADRLHKVIRAHGNTAEYAPFIAVLILYLGSRTPAAWVVWTMVAITVSRVMIVAGLVFAGPMNRANPLRFLGALGTYVFGLALCLALVVG
jgi:uncharacterized membrane protein YecN with MAPEG domain